MNVSSESNISFSIEDEDSLILSEEDLIDMGLVGKKEIIFSSKTDLNENTEIEIKRIKELRIINKEFIFEDPLAKYQQKSSKAKELYDKKKNIFIDPHASSRAPSLIG
jgi:hypothetical protein